MSTSRTRVWLLLTLLVTAGLFAPVLANDFALDDRVVALGIGDNGLPRPMIHRLQPLSTYFSSHYWADTVESDLLFRPVTILSFALRYALCGDSGTAAHGINLLLHLGAVLLVHAMLARLSFGPRARLLGTAVFALHAVHSEAVAGVVGRAELLAFCFGAGGTLLALADSGGRPGLWAGAAFAWFLAFGSKESALGWPAFAVVLGLAGRARDRAPMPSALWPLLLRVGAIAALPVLAFLYLRSRMIAGLPFEPSPIGHSSNPVAYAGAATRIPTATTVLGYGLWLCLAPFRLAADYGASVFRVRGVDAPAVLSFLVLGGSLVGGILVRRRQPALFVAAAAFFGFSFLTSNLAFPIGTIFGERLYYAPSLAISFLAAWLVDLPALRGRWFPAALALWLIACAGQILRRNGVWKDSRTLYLHDVAAQPRSVRLQLGAGFFRMREGNIEGALACVEAALALDAENAMAWNSLARIQLSVRALDDAARSARRALGVKRPPPPEDRAKLHETLGSILRQQGRNEQAAGQFWQALRWDPLSYPAWRALLELVPAGTPARDDLRRQIEERAAQDANDEVWAVYRGLLAAHDGKAARAARLLAGALPRLRRHLNTAVLYGDARLTLARARVRTGASAAARADCKQLAADPYLPDWIRARARALLAETRGRR